MAFIRWFSLFLKVGEESGEIHGAAELGRSRPGQIITDLHSAGAPGTLLSRNRERSLHDRHLASLLKQLIASKAKKMRLPTTNRGARHWLPTLVIRSKHQFLTRSWHFFCHDNGTSPPCARMR